MGKWIKTGRTAIRSLRQHKLRSLLSVLGIVCGVMAVLSMISIGEGAKQELVGQIEQLGTRNIYLKAVRLTPDQQRKARAGLSAGLTLRDITQIQNGVPGVERVAALKEISATIPDIRGEVSPQTVAIAAAYGSIQNLELFQGRFIGPMDVQQKHMVCVLGSAVAAGLGVRGKLGQYVRIENHLFRIIGILGRFHRKDPKVKAIAVRNYNEMIFIPLGTESSLIRPGNRETMDEERGLSEIIIQVHHMDQVLNTANVVERIVQVTHNNVKDYQMVIPRELLQQAQKTQRTFNMVLGAIAGVSLLVGGIGIMNIMLATVTERTREIGIRRAVGANRYDIVVQFLVEAVILTFTGGLIGIVAGIGAVAMIAHLSGWHTLITPWAITAPLVMSVLAGLFFGLYPAVQAARMDPVAALRHE